MRDYIVLEMCPVIQLDTELTSVAYMGNVITRTGVR